MIAWTHSALSAFETCPKKFFHVKVARDVVEPPTEHTVWGERVHSAFEAALLGGSPLPDGMRHWQGVATKFAALPGQKLVEYKLSIDRNFAATSWSNAWAKGIADYIVVKGPKAAVCDWKTGKVKPSDQLKLYAGLVMHAFPEVQSVDTAFVWLAHRKITRDNFTRESLPLIWREFLPRVNRLEQSYEKDSWPARPSGLCRGWCPVKECKYYEDKRR